MSDIRRFASGTYDALIHTPVIGPLVVSANGNAIPKRSNEDYKPSRASVVYNAVSVAGGVLSPWIPFAMRSATGTINTIYSLCTRKSNPEASVANAHGASRSFISVAMTGAAIACMHALHLPLELATIAALPMAALDVRDLAREHAAYNRKSVKAD